MRGGLGISLCVCGVCVEGAVGVVVLQYEILQYVICPLSVEAVRKF